MKPTIGIVLSSVPGYSETFFRNKIRGLQNDGGNVILFLDSYSSKDKEFPCKLVHAGIFNGSLVKVSYSLIKALLKSVFYHPKKSYKFFRLERKDGISLVKSIRSVLVNEHIISSNLDWLHFGFGMLAVGRENVAEAIGAKMAVSFRGFDLYLSPLKHPNCYDRLFKKQITYHVLSEEMKDDLFDYGIHRKHIHVITPAINVEFFKSSIKKIFGKPIKILTVARLHWKKGLEYSLEAMVYLKNNQIPFMYTVVGEGEEYERLIFAANQLAIQESVDFVGKLTPKQVKLHLDNNDLYLQYSIQEGFCNSVLEAQSMGLLCVVSDAEGLQENVIHNETGWVVAKRQPELLATRIRAILDLSEDDKQAFRDRAIDRIKQDFNLDKQQNAFLKFYASKN